MCDVRESNSLMGSSYLLRQYYLSHSITVTVFKFSKTNLQKICVIVTRSINWCCSAYNYFRILCRSKMPFGSHYIWEADEWRKTRFTTYVSSDIVNPNKVLFLNRATAMAIGSVSGRLGSVVFAYVIGLLLDYHCSEAVVMTFALFIC